MARIYNDSGKQIGVKDDKTGKEFFWKIKKTPKKKTEKKEAE